MEGRATRWPAAARSSSHEQNLTRGRPLCSPAARSASSIDVQPDVLDDARAALGEQRVDGCCGRLGLWLEPSGGDVLEQELDGLGRVLLVRADHARRAALDPAGAVDAVPHAAALVRDRAGALVEGDAGQLDAAVADAAEDEPALERLGLVSRDRALVLVEDVADELDPLDPLVPEDRYWRAEELEDDAPRLSFRLASRRARGGRRGSARRSCPSARRPRGRPDRRRRRRRRARPSPAAPAS